MRIKVVLAMAVLSFFAVDCGKDKNPAGPGVTPPAGMKSVGGGTYVMGDLTLAAAQPVHSVMVSSFYMDSTEVTQADYNSLMGVNPSTATVGDSYPVTRASWFDAALYCNARSRRDSLDTVYSYTSIAGIAGNGCSDLVGLAIDISKNGYRLPTEAEWEYACRAGTTTQYYWGRNYPLTTLDDTLAADSNAVWAYNAGGNVDPVATKKPNARGLYDMAGNVWEWCQDWYVVPYDTQVTTDPTGPATGTSRVHHSGSYLATVPNRCTSSYRIMNLPSSRFSDNGFRCVKR